MRQMELEIRPLFLVPDTNGFIDHLASLARLLESRKYILVVPLIGESGQSSLARAKQPPLHTCPQPQGPGRQNPAVCVRQDLQASRECVGQGKLFNNQSSSNYYG